MEQYIPKSALVAEIENLENTYKKCPTRNSYEDGLKDGRLIGYKDALYKINAIEVKEVNIEHLEQEVKDFCYKFDDRKDKWYNMTPHDKNIVTNPTWSIFAMKLAKHFFGLGLLSTITEEDCKLIWNIGDEIPNMTEEEFFKELLKRYKAQKGEEV